MVEDLRHPTDEVQMALVGKYVSLHDAYISVVEALKHGGITNHATVHIKWIDSETVTPENVEELLGDCNGVLVPGGFGSRGIEGKILAIQYARTHGIPFLGLCLGMQLTIVEYARNVIGYTDAHSVELDPNTTHPVIALMPDQNGVEDIGGTLRLGHTLVYWIRIPVLISSTDRRISPRDIVIVMRSTTIIVPSSPNTVFVCPVCPLTDVSWKCASLPSTPSS